MAQYLFPPAVPAALRVVGETALFPVRRVYCVGRNYRAHSREMIQRQAAQLLDELCDNAVLVGGLAVIRCDEARVCLRANHHATVHVAQRLLLLVEILDL